MGATRDPDARHALMIYITTFGRSVWWGPAAGDPKAPEDVIETSRRM